MTAQYLGSCHSVGGPDGVTDSWLQPDPTLAAMGIWIEVCLCAYSLTLSAFQVDKNK